MSYFKIIFILVLGLLSACQSLPDKVQKSLSEEDYKSAYDLLIKQGVDEKLESDLNEDQLKAKLIYTESIESVVKDKRNEYLAKGYARASLDFTRENISLCPWSKSLQFYLNEDESRVDLINSYISESRRTGNSELADEALLSKHVEITQFLSDSPSAEIDATSRFVRFTRSSLNKINDENLSGSLLKKSLESVARLTHIPEFEFNPINDFISLENTIRFDSEYLANSETEAEILNRLGDRTDWRQGNDNQSPISIVNAYSKIRLINAIADHTNRGLTSGSPRDGIDVAEERYAKIVDLRPLVENQLATSHINAAEERANGGMAAFISLVHLERANSLIGTSDRQEKIKKSAAQSFANSPKPKEYIFVDVPPNAKPGIQNIIKSFVVSEFIQRSNKLIDWQFATIDKRVNAAIEINITDIDWKPDQDNIKKKSSRYLSHYQDVENPMKSILKSQVDSDRSSVEWAERDVERARDRLDSEIRSHNWNPTEWSMRSVNSARDTFNREYNDYVRQFNALNSLISRYNSTSNTISQPVHMSYSYSEGMVSHGISLSGQVSTRAGTSDDDHSGLVAVKASSVETDLVRWGTKSSDVSVSSRRDDPLEIDNSWESQVDHVIKAIDDLFDSAYEPLGNFSPSADLAQDMNEWELRILGSRMHPIYNVHQRNAQNVPLWASPYIDSINLPEIGAKVIEEVILLGPRPAPEILNGLDDIVPKYGSALVEIITDGGSGSGCIVSDQGHVLTCAHVIQSSGVLINFPYMPDVGTRNAKVIYSSQKDDVAILQIEDPPDGIKSIPLALESPLITGEKVVAMGNPNVLDVEIKGAVTMGDVSRAADENNVGFQNFHMLDITVASGSSGGPVIRLRDGLVVGVVTAVLSEEFNENYASSGNMALAAPVDKLDEVLLLRYE